MDCTHKFFSGHAIRRMFERDISKDVVVQLIDNGEIIASYPDDTPYPSYLLLGFSQSQPLHVVVGQSKQSGDCYVVTIYRPDPGLWRLDFKARK